MRSPAADRIAGAPITWGVCEVPGWGHQMGAERVLAEMRELGLGGTEVGPEGFLPSSASEARSLLEDAGLRAVAGFVPVLLHEAARVELEVARLRRRAAELAATGASVVAIAVSTGRQGYESGSALDAEGWRRLGEALDRVCRAASDEGMLATVHPHHGTLVATADEVGRVLEVSDVGLCLDTGHLVVGGADPRSVVREAGDRVRHVHLKDVEASMADKVREGVIGYRDAVAQGMYRPLGRGHADIAGIVRDLEAGGYDGWHVLEQDAVLEADPETGAGPVNDARASLTFLARLWGEIADDGGRRSAAQDRAGKEGP